MSTDNNDICANCGKGEEESINLKKCGACKMVKYCSGDCQKAHRSQHKKECRKRAAELQTLFKQPPPQLEDCPICFMRMPSLPSGSKYNTCCGKTICSGCIHAVVMTKGINMCPFCRALAPETDDEIIKRVMKRVDIGDAHAIYSLGYYYSTGMYGLTQDHAKALELYHQAAELGHAASCNNTGHAYKKEGIAVETNEKKANSYYELAAMGGDEYARHNLGVSEFNKGNYEKALKHFMIAAGGGLNTSLNIIQQMYTRVEMH